MNLESSIEQTPHHNMSVSVGQLPATKLGTGPRGLVRAASRGTPINTTEGWDTVFAVPVPEVNKRFAKAGLYPTSFAASVKGELYDTEITGNFGAWQIEVGGSGGLIMILTPVATGTMTVGNKTIPLDGAKIYVMVKLEYLPQPDQGKDGTPNRLLVRTRQMDDTGHIAHVEQVKIPNETDPTVISAAETGFQSFFDANLALVTHVFNTVNLNAIADDAGFQWLKPTDTEYAYHDADSIDKAVFGVLCMVLGNSRGDNQNVLGPAAIPDGAQAGFSISSQLLLREMVLPVIALAFNAGTADSDIEAEYFLIQDNDTEIVNTKNIPMKKVSYGGLNYHPVCTDFKLTLDQTQLTIYTHVKTTITPGIRAHVELTSYYDMTLATDANGVQYLNYDEVSKAEQNVWTETDTAIVVTEVIVGIIGLVADGIVTAVLKGVQRVVICIVIAVVAAVAAVVPELIAQVQAKGVEGNIPSIDTLVTHATSNVKWTGGEDFKITSVALNGSLQLGGTAFTTD